MCTRPVVMLFDKTVQFNSIQLITFSEIKKLPTVIMRFILHNQPDNRAQYKFDKSLFTLNKFNLNTLQSISSETRIILKMLRILVMTTDKKKLRP